MKRIIWILLILITGFGGYSQTSNDADAEAFITALNADPSGVDLTTAEMNYITQMVEGMKSIGVWGKITTCYPFVGGTAFKHKFNLKDPRDLDGAFRLVFTNVTHSANGIVGNGTSSIANTFINSTTINKNSVAFGIYPTVVNNTGVLGGFRESSNVRLSLNNGAFSAMSQTTTAFTFKQTLLLINRNSANTSYILVDQNFTNQNVLSIVSSQVNTIGLLNRYVEGSLTPEPATFFNGALGFAFLTSSGLTDQQAIQLSHLIYYCQGILQRQ